MSSIKLSEIHFCNGTENHMVSNDEKQAILEKLIGKTAHTDIHYNPDTIKTIREKIFSEKQIFFSIKKVLIIIQKRIRNNILHKESLLISFIKKLLKVKLTTTAHKTKGIQEPRGAKTTIGQKNNETNINAMQEYFSFLVWNI